MFVPPWRHDAAATRDVDLRNSATISDTTSGGWLTPKWVDLAIAGGAFGWIIEAIAPFAHTPFKSLLWYFPIMQTKSASTLRPARSTKPPPRGTRFRSGLAEAHAKALHRLVPPVYFDDDGYVCEDNSHMPEGEVHFPIVSYWHGALYGHYGPRGRLVCVLADHLLLVDRDVGTAAVVPDVMVAFDVEPGDRLSYKVWQEPKAPDFVLEVLSQDTWRADVFEKPALYADLGVLEYWVFDPRGIRRGGPQLEGWRLRRGGEHDPLPSSSGGDGHSELLGLDLVPKGKSLWLRDPESGLVLPDHAGAIKERDHANVERQRAEAGRQRAEAKQQRAEAKRQRAELQRQRAEGENARLRAEIRQLRSGKT